MAELTLELPDELVSEIEARVGRTEFNSTEEYVRFILEEVVEEGDYRRALEDEDQKELPHERLRDLGYL